jgi:hypothetical protein
MEIEGGVKAMAPQNRRCLRAVVFEGNGSAENGALAKSKAVSSHRTCRLKSHENYSQMPEAR